MRSDVVQANALIELWLNLKILYVDHVNVFNLIIPLTDYCTDIERVSTSDRHSLKMDVMKTIR